MNDVTKRFIQAYNKLTETGLATNAKEFAGVIGISASMMTEILKGRSNVGAETIQNTVLKYHISPTFLLTGGGTVFDSSADQKNTGQATADCVRIPVTDPSPGSSPTPLNPGSPDTPGQIQLPASMLQPGKRYHCIRLKGESMQPSLPGGSHLILRLLAPEEWEYMPDGQIYALSDTTGKTYVRRIRRQPDGDSLRLISDNPDKTNYPDQILPAGQIKAISYIELYISRQLPDVHQAFSARVSQLEDEIAAFNAKLQDITRLLNS